MLLKIFYYSLLIFLAMTPQVFASPSCETRFKDNNTVIERRGRQPQASELVSGNDKIPRAVDSQSTIRATIQTTRHLLKKGASSVRELFRRRVISSDDLDLPPLTDREVQLAKQGFSRKFTAAIDLVNEWGIVRRRLEELKANPRTTHIEYFANQIPDHIAYIRTGLVVEAQSDPHLAKIDLAAQLKVLDSLEAKAKKAVSNNQVTYKWWLEFNLDLSRLMSDAYYYYPTPYRWNKDKQSAELQTIKKHLSEFPSIILVPTIKGEDIGLIAFRKARENRVYPIGLINRPRTRIDSIPLSAYHTIIHDIRHAEMLANRPNPFFNEKLGAHIDALSPIKRKKVEMIYFLMTHENGALFIITHSEFFTPEQIRREIVSNIYTESAGLFTFPDPTWKQKKVEDLADTFMEVYSQALQHQ